MTVVEQITRAVEHLSPTQQQTVLSFARALQPAPGNTLPAGAQLKDLLQFAGSIPGEDLRQMERAIEEGCEQVNPNAW